MMRSVRGVYHNGKIQPLEEPEDITEANDYECAMNCEFS